jgi:hypothetical protein
LLIRDVLSGCIWDTKPVLLHQEDVPLTSHPRTTGTSQATTYYYAMTTNITARRTLTATALPLMPV